MISLGIHVKIPKMRFWVARQFKKITSLSLRRDKDLSGKIQGGRKRKKVSKAYGRKEERVSQCRNLEQDVFKVGRMLPVRIFLVYWTLRSLHVFCSRIERAWGWPRHNCRSRWLGGEFFLLVEFLECLRTTQISIIYVILLWYYVIIVENNAYHVTVY